MLEITVSARTYLDAYRMAHADATAFFGDSGLGFDLRFRNAEEDIVDRPIGSDQRTVILWAVHFVAHIKRDSQ